MHSHRLPAASATTQRSFQRLEESKGSLRNYKLGQHIGRGAFSTVRLATFVPTNEPVAIKSYDKLKLTDLNKRAGIRREVKILQKLDHPNTIKMLEFLETSKELSIVMEYIGMHSLQTHLKKRGVPRLAEAEAKPIFRQVVDGLAYCHSKRITHRDIKPENLILNQDRQVKIIDFGFATCMKQGTKNRLYCGTPSYMAPEIVSRKEYLGPPADVWALGVLLFVLLSGSHPFRGASDRELHRSILKGEFVVPAGLSRGAADLISKLLRANPQTRPTCEDILQDHWLQFDSSLEV